MGMLSVSGPGSPWQHRVLAGHNERNVLLLNTLAERSNWGSPAPGNVQGVAFAYSDESTAGEVFEASVRDDGRVRLHKITHGA